MPEFQMDKAGRVTLGAKAVAGRMAFEPMTWPDLDSFTQGYIEALFFTAEEDIQAAGFAGLAPETLARILADCAAFQAAAGPLIDGEEERAGADFWFTRNGHGVGFWEAGRWPEPAADTLDRLARVGGVDAYLGDDGKVYLG